MTSKVDDNTNLFAEWHSDFKSSHANSTAKPLHWTSIQQLLPEKNKAVRSVREREVTVTRENSPMWSSSLIKFDHSSRSEKFILQENNNHAATVTKFEFEPDPPERKSNK